MTLKIEISDIALDHATKILQKIKEIGLSVASSIKFSYGGDAAIPTHIICSDSEISPNNPVFQRYISGTKKEGPGYVGKTEC